MKVEFLKSKSGTITCKIDSKFLHSSYNPEKEADKFVENFPKNISPELIILIAPGLPYCYNLLKKKYPNAKIAAVNFHPDFTNKEWDLQWTPSGITSLEAFVNETLSQYNLKKIHIEIWFPALGIWKKEIEYFQSLVKKTINKEIAITLTRRHFGKRWFKNIIRNTLLITNPIIIKDKIPTPVFIAAAGQSLEDKLTLLNNDVFFKIAVTSATGFFYYHEIIPDMFFITDGGFWAKEHFLPCFFTKDCDFKSHYNNLAISMEAAIPGGILKTQNIIPMTYNSPFTKQILKINGLEFMDAKENGTVTGTALEFALENSEQNIYLSGLDLCPGPNSFHARPGVQETRNRNEVNRILPFIENIPIKSNQMDIYKSWFENLNENIKKRIYMVTPTLNSINSFTTISKDDLAEICKNIKKINCNFFKQETVSFNEKKINTINFLNKQIQKAQSYNLIKFIEDNILCDIISYISWDSYNSLLMNTDSCNKTNTIDLFEDMKTNFLTFIDNEIKRMKNIELQ